MLVPSAPAADLVLPSLAPPPYPPMQPAARRLITTCAALHRHAVWHIHAFYAARALEAVTLTARAQARGSRNVYFLLATDASDQWDA